MSAPRRYRVRIQIIAVYDVTVIVDKPELSEGCSWEDEAVVVAHDLSTNEIRRRGHLVNVFSDSAEVVEEIS